MKKLIFAIALISLVSYTQEIRAQDLENILEQVADGTNKAYYQSLYQFDIHLVLEVSDMGGKIDLYEGYLSKDGEATAIIFPVEGEESTIILDRKNNSVIILSSSGEDKTGIALALHPDALAAMAASVQEEVEYDSYENFKTGKTRDILGYTCEEYLIEEEGKTIRMWVSDELGEKVDKSLITNQQVFGGAFAHAAGTEGMPLEYIYKDNTTGDQRSLKVKKIDFNTEFKVNTREYTIMVTGS
jgi:hypothetical protein